MTCKANLFWTVIQEITIQESFVFLLTLNHSIATYIPEVFEPLSLSFFTWDFRMLVTNCD